MRKKLAELNATKKVFKLSDLSAKPFTFELEHPQHGLTGATITIVSTNCNAFIQKTMQLNQAFAAQPEESIPYEDKMKHTAELYATIVTGWDETFFEKECTTENVIELFLDPQNMWILTQVTTELAKNENFFPKI